MNEKDETKQFRKSLQDFWASRGHNNLKIPQIGGRELNLYHLYKAVCKRGGAQVVSQNKLWKEIVNEFGLPPSCTSASFTLRNHYSKYLLAYEQKYLFGREDDAAIPELLGIRERKKFKKNEESFRGNESPQGSVSNADLKPNTMGEKGFTNANQSSLNQILQEKYQGLDKNQEIFYTRKNKIYPMVSEIKRILLAFESHLQEEIMFAINSLLLFSSNPNVSFMLEQYPALLDNVTHYLEIILSNIPSLLGNEKKTTSENLPLNVLEHYNHPVNTFTNKPVEGFRAGESYVTLRYETISEVHLIEQVISLLQIIRNLSFLKSNDHAIYKHEKLHPMIIDLFLKTNNPNIQKNALEILSNTSKFIQVKQLHCEPNLFLNKLLGLLSSENIEDVESTVESLRHLIVFQENEVILEELLNNCLEDLNKLLISPSIEVREGVLELLCFLSDLKMSTRVSIARQPKCVMRLIALLSSGVGKKNDKITKLCALILSNVSLAPASKSYLLPYERDLFIVAATDECVSKIICNVLGDLDNLGNEPSFKH